MAKGTEIYAAKGGIVKDIKNDSDLSGKTPHFIKHANYIKVLHSDQTMAFYAHLQKGGVLVKKGQSIREGEKIGLSGCTGYCDGAHLHFEVFKPANNKKGRVSLPFKFITHLGVLDSLKRQHTYKSTARKVECK